jgi:hypothetical protein
MQLPHRSLTRLAHASVKVLLPHERYQDVAATLPLLIKQALAQAASDADVAPLVLDQCPPGFPGPGGGGGGPLAAAAAPGAEPPCLLHYTHFPGCLAAILAYQAPSALPPASRLAAALADLLPEGAQLVHVSTQDAATGRGSTHSTAAASSGGCQALAQRPWLDPVALPCGEGSCAVEVVVPAQVLRQLPAAGAAGGRQLRVVLAEAGGGALSDGVVDVEGSDVIGKDVDASGAVEVRTVINDGERPCWQQRLWVVACARCQPLLPLPPVPSPHPAPPCPLHATPLPVRHGQATDCAPGDADSARMSS